MKYRAMAKRFIFDTAKNATPTTEDGEYLTPEGKAFTDRQLDKFVDAISRELDRLERKLVG